MKEKLQEIITDLEDEIIKYDIEVSGYDKEITQAMEDLNILIMNKKAAVKDRKECLECSSVFNLLIMGGAD